MKERDIPVPGGNYKCSKTVTRRFERLRYCQLKRTVSLCSRNLECLQSRLVVRFITYQLLTFFQLDMYEVDWNSCIEPQSSRVFHLNDESAKPLVKSRDSSSL